MEAVDLIGEMQLELDPQSVKWSEDRDSKAGKFLGLLWVNASADRFFWPQKETTHGLEKQSPMEQLVGTWSDLCMYSPAASFVLEFYRMENWLPDEQKR